MAKSKAAEAKPIERPAPDSSERETIATAAGRVLDRRPRVEVAMAGTSITSPHTDQMGWTARVMDAVGSRSLPFTEMLVDQMARQGRWGGQSATDVKRLNAMLAIMDGCQPANEVEAMLLAQMAASHDLGMEMAWRSKQADMLPQLEAIGNLAVKLMRTFALQAEALAKLKRGGEQRVKVEHLHVHSGGQAIVGNVQTGGGVPAKTEDQPHAITDASNDLLRCEDAQGEPVPIPANGQRPL